MPTGIEAAKRNAAIRAVKDHFDASASYIGIGSGTTIVHVVEAIQALGINTSHMRFVPTGYQSRQVILHAGLTPIAFDSLPAGVLLDVAFDGADEIDDDLNCIKGGGACLYQEKLVAVHARKFICVADHRKLQHRLLTTWSSIPIEVEPLSLQSVLSDLRAMGSSNPLVRTGTLSKAGPLKTDQDNFIIDAPFATLLLRQDLSFYARQDQASSKLAMADGSQHPQPKLEGRGRDGKWEVEALAKEIKMIEGVLSVGIFSGEDGHDAIKAGRGKGGQKPVACYFGMADGTVVVKTASRNAVATGVAEGANEAEAKETQKVPGA